MKLILPLLLLTLRLSASTTNITVNTALAATPFTNTVALPRFNGLLGKLTNIVINTSWTHSMTNHAESLDYNPFSYSIDVASAAELRFSDGSVVKTNETHATWFAGDFNNQGAVDDLRRIKTDYMNARVCQDFSKFKEIWIGTGTMPFKAVMTSVVTPFTTPSTAAFVQTSSSYGSFSVTIMYFYQPGPPGNGLCL